jgi:hypothetical protein
LLVDLFPRQHAGFVDAPTGIWLVYPSCSYVPAKVRAFIDFVRHAMRPPARTRAGHSGPKWAFQIGADVIPYRTINRPSHHEPSNR